MNIDEAFAVVARELRRNAKLTQQEVADFIGFRRHSIWEMETARVSTKLATLQKLAFLYEMTLEELMRRTVNAGRDQGE